MHAQKLPNGRWAARYKTPDGRHHRTAGHRTRAEALAAGAAKQDLDAYVFPEGEEGDVYYVGRYWTPEGWKETFDGFDTEEDALAEAQELQRTARAGARPGM